MIITMSPAKIMQFGTKDDLRYGTQPIFRDERCEVVSRVRSLSIEEVMKLMKIGYKQAVEVVSWFASFDAPYTPENLSASCYNGLAYKGLAYQTLSVSERNYAETHLLIGSAVYGFLRPSDKIRPYRLELGASLKMTDGKTLYEFWRTPLTAFLSKALRQDDGTWLNLASDEYSKVINRTVLPKNVCIVTPQFREATSNGYRQVVVHTKKARGLMARFVVQHRIESVGDLRAFDSEGYTFSEHLSKENEPVFVR